MQDPIMSVVSLLGRLMISGIFLASALGNKIPNFSQVTEVMANEGVPVPGLMLAGAITFLIVGGLSIISGYQARIGASLLLIFLLLATYFFHDFWNFEGPERQAQMIQFMKNSALMGTMLLILANGPGLLSFDKTAPVENQST